MSLCFVSIKIDTKQAILYRRHQTKQTNQRCYTRSSAATIILSNTTAKRANMIFFAQTTQTYSNIITILNKKTVN